jgi:hypothetical protein
MNNKENLRQLTVKAVPGDGLIMLKFPALVKKNVRPQCSRQKELISQYIKFK